MGWVKRGRFLARARSIRGQASIMIGMMMLTFILLFAFVVNTGMLINAKINLQNAADLAAYAGAAVQARQLTRISYLNYEMRRQYKKFLYRYYVIGNMAQASFPTSGGSGPMVWSPDLNPADSYGVPAVCVIFNSNNNYCQLRALPQIQIPDPSPLDSINATLRDQLQKIELIRQQNCVKIGHTNIMILNSWLFNTDPDYSTLTQQLDTLGNIADVIEIVKGLGWGLGLIPREVILAKRILTLSDYVNTPGQMGLTKDTVDGMKNSADPSASERTIQAFYSAYHTLGDHTFSDTQSIVMDELLPGSGTQGNLLNLIPIKKQNMTTFAIDFGMPFNSTSPTDCYARLTEVPVQSAIPLGFYKDPKVLTYYTVRLKAKARVLFSPFGDMDLKAYAAAQPFGSRIGPGAPFGPENFFWMGAPAVGQGIGTAVDIPNLPIKENEGTGRGQGWDRQEVISAMYQKLVSVPGVNGTNSGTIISQVQPSDMERAYQAAMVPNPYEGNRYNIINDLGADPFVRNFDSQRIAAFWAPIFAPGKNTDLTAELRSIMGTLPGTNVDPVVAGKIRDAIINGINIYVAKLRQGQNQFENGEGFNIVRIADPFYTRPDTTGASQLISFPNGIMQSDPAKIKTSWANTVNDSNVGQQGRVGYSVKLVSFDSLMHNKLPSDGQNTWSNDFGDEESSQDLVNIKH